MAKQGVAAGEGLLGSIRTNPATGRLTDQARQLLDAQVDQVVGKVGGAISGAAGRLESGQLPALGEGAKRLLSGDGLVKSALGGAKAGLSNTAGRLMDKVKGLAGGKGKGSGETKATVIEESIDVGVPLTAAYNQWTQFTDFSRFMKGVESVEQVSETETNWRAKVFKSHRTWKATIQEQIPDERIVWTSEGPKGSTKGVVTFHSLGDNLTRVLLNIEYFPNGFVEKTGNLWRAAGRRARLDLKNYRRFVTMEGEETGAWRGEIRDGQVVKSGDESAEGEEEQQAREQPEQRDQREDKPARRRPSARPHRRVRERSSSQSDEDSSSSDSDEQRRGRQPA
jgi:uncharacterized membrane protein